MEQPRAWCGRRVSPALHRCRKPPRGLQGARGAPSEHTPCSQFPSPCNEDGCSGSEWLTQVTCLRQRRRQAASGTSRWAGLVTRTLRPGKSHMFLSSRQTLCPVYTSGDTFLWVFWGSPRLLSTPSITALRAGVSCAQTLGLRGGRVLKSQDDLRRWQFFTHHGGAPFLCRAGDGERSGAGEEGSGPCSSQRLPHWAPEPSGRRACSGASPHSALSTQSGLGFGALTGA